MIDISEAVPEDEIRTRLDEMDVFQPDDWTDGDRIHVNGDIYGVHKRGKNLVTQFKNARRRGAIRPEVSSDTTMSTKTYSSTLTREESYVQY